MSGLPVAGSFGEDSSGCVVDGSDGGDVVGVGDVVDIVGIDVDELIDGSVEVDEPGAVVGVVGTTVVAVAGMVDVEATVLVDAGMVVLVDVVLVSGSVEVVLVVVTVQSPVPVSVPVTPFDQTAVTVSDVPEWLT